MSALLEIEGLTVDFDGFAAVDQVALRIDAGEVLGIVGESGSGKSVTMLALMGLIDAPGKVSASRLAFDGKELLALSARERRRIIGKDIAMVFQDATSSLNPSYTVGYQIAEMLRQHQGLRGRALQKRVLELLEQVEMPDARRRVKAYPHQLSGGMNQRVMIAMAIACAPKLLIADEPTTALDVTIQAQVMSLLRNLQQEHGMALILISHDLAVVSEVAERVAVMYAGEIIEENRSPRIFTDPHHPYTEALLAAIPEHNRGASRLFALPGLVPGRDDRPPGCVFEPRCRYRVPACNAARPALLPVAERLAASSQPGEPGGQPMAGQQGHTPGMSPVRTAPALAEAVDAMLPALAVPLARARCIKPLHAALELEQQS